MDGKDKVKIENLAGGRVTAEHKGIYKVQIGDAEYSAKITGRRMFEASGREDYPTVGDFVAVALLNGEQAVIREILPRKTIVRRKHGDKTRLGRKDQTQVIAANIDVAFVVQSVDRDFSLNRLERYFAIAREGGVKPAVILNKVDLISEGELEGKLAQIKNRFPDVDVIPASAATAQGQDELLRYITEGKTYCFLGSSGVGKSSLINKLLRGGDIKTGNISRYSGRGKHVTTARQMYFLSNGGIVIDNPGMREVGMGDAESGIGAIFDEIDELGQECKYANCTHVHEPGCAVLFAVKSGELNEGKYANCVRLRGENEYYEMSDSDKKEKDRRFGKFMKKAKEEFKRFRGNGE